MPAPKQGARLGSGPDHQKLMLAGICASLFRQGSMLYELMPNMNEFLLLPLIERFAHMLAGQPLFAQMFGAV